MSERLAAAGWAPDPPDRYCPRCGHSVGPGELVPLDGNPDRTARGELACSRCWNVELFWARLVRLGSYEGLLRDLILELKFTRWRRVGDELGRRLGHALLTELRESGRDLAGVALAPIPPSARRRFARGIDHGMVLARGISATSGLPIEPLLLRKHGPQQAGLPRSRRWQNVRGKFLPRPGAGPPARLVVLVDDIVTTGATMRAASEAVRKLWRDTDIERTAPAASPELWCACAAVTPEQS